MKIRTLSILEKQKLIVLMGKDFAIIKIPKKLSTVNSKMANLKEWVNSISQVATTILVNSNLIRKMEEDCISGQESSLISTKESS